MTWHVALTAALALSRAHGVRYRVYSVRLPLSSRWRWFVCPVEGR